MNISIICLVYYIVLAHAALIPTTRAAASNVTSNVTVPVPLVGSGILQVPLTKVNNVTAPSRKRQLNFPLSNPSHGYLYLVTVGFGTPVQQITLQVDTGTSEIWLNPSCAVGGAPHPTFCSSYPQYIYYNSNSAVSLGTSVYTNWNLDGSVGGYVVIEANYYTDTVTIGERSILAQEFGLCFTTGGCTGLDISLMGIGFGNGYQTSYNNIIDQLWLQGITQSRAFSIDLASVDQSSGSITFGGIDTMKFAGPLVAVPIISWHELSSLKQQYYVYLTSVGMTNASKSTTWTASGFQQNVILDTGLWISLLPQDLVTSMISGFLGVVSQGSGRYTISCSYIADKTTTVDFGFVGITIRVPIHEFMYYDGTLCWFRAAGIPAGQQAYLGDTFLRAVYAVYDQDNMNIWLAQAASCGTNLVAIGSGSGAVKSTTGACGVPTTSTTTSASTTPTAPPQSTIYVTITSISTFVSSTTLPGQTLTLPGSTTTVAKTTVSKTTTKTEITKMKTTITKTTTKACKT